MCVCLWENGGKNSEEISSGKVSALITLQLHHHSGLVRPPATHFPSLLCHRKIFFQRHIVGSQEEIETNSEGGLQHPQQRRLFHAIYKMGRGCNNCLPIDYSCANKSWKVNLSLAIVIYVLVNESYLLWIPLGTSTFTVFLWIKQLIYSNYIVFFFCLISLFKSIHKDILYKLCLLV